MCVAPGTAVKIKMHSGPIVLNTAGDATVVYPGGAFPSVVLGVVAGTKSSDESTFNDLAMATWHATLAACNVRCYSRGCADSAALLMAIGV